MTDEILSSGLLEILSGFIVLGVLLMCFISTVYPMRPFMQGRIFYTHSVSYIPSQSNVYVGIARFGVKR